MDDQDLSDQTSSPTPRALEPLSEADEDEILVEDHAEDDAGETNAVKKQIQPVKPSDQDIDCVARSMRPLLVSRLV